MNTYRPGEQSLKFGLNTATSAILQEEKELEKCTFRPKINKLDHKKSNLYGIGVRTRSRPSSQTKSKSFI